MLLAYGHWKPAGRGANCGASESAAEWCREDGTYAGGLASADVVRQTWDVARVAHEDGSLDLLLRGRGDRNDGAREALVGVTTTAVCVIEDLTALNAPMSTLSETRMDNLGSPASSRLAPTACPGTAG